MLAHRTRRMRSHPHARLKAGDLTQGFPASAHIILPESKQNSEARPAAQPWSIKEGTAMTPHSITTAARFWTDGRAQAPGGQPRTMTWVARSWPSSATWPPAGTTPWNVSSASSTVSRDVFQNCAIATSRLAPGVTGSVMHVVDDVVTEIAFRDWLGRVCGRICVVCTRKSFGVAWSDAVRRSSAQDAPGGTCTKWRCSSPGWNLISPSCTLSLHSGGHAVLGKHADLLDLYF